MSSQAPVKALILAALVAVVAIISVFYREGDHTGYEILFHNWACIDGEGCVAGRI